jgi:hypothetical protein
VQHCKTLRFINKIPIILPYNKHNANKSTSRYTNTLDVAVKQLIKTYYTQSFGLRNNKFKYTKDLISFINGLFPTKDLKFSVDLINKKKEQKDRMKTSTLHLLKTKTKKQTKTNNKNNKTPVFNFLFIFLCCFCCCCG